MRKILKSAATTQGIFLTEAETNQKEGDHENLNFPDPTEVEINHTKFDDLPLQLSLTRNLSADAKNQLLTLNPIEKLKKRKVLNSRRSAHIYGKGELHVPLQVKNRWEKVVAKVLVDFIPQTGKKYDDYFDPLPIRPGISFYESLIKSFFPLESLKLGIPDTLCIIETINILKIKKGCLHKKKAGHLNEFFDLLKSHCGYELDSEEKMMMPAAIVRRESNSHGFSSEVLDWNELLTVMRTGSLDNRSLVQRYTYSYNDKHGRGHVNKLRFVYYPESGKIQKACYGITMSNRIDANDPKASLNSKFKLSYTTNSFEYYLSSGSSVSAYKAYATNIHHYLLKYYGYRIEYLVCDFLKDPLGQIWFLSLRSFKLEEQNYKIKAGLIIDMGRELNAGPKRETVCPISCTLCRNKFKRADVEKQLPYKMLSDMAYHQRKRGLNALFMNVKNRAPEAAMHNCRVCNLCYQLIVREHQLIEMEREFAIAQFIPISPTAQLQNENKSAQQNKELHKKKEIINPSGLKRMNMHEWRILIYVRNITNVTFPYTELSKPHFIEYDLFDNSPSVWPVIFVGQGNKPSFLASNILSLSGVANSASAGSSPTNNGGIISAFAQKLFAIMPNPSPKALKVPKDPDARKKHSFKINKMRVHYFFSNDTNITNFLSNLAVKFVLRGGERKGKEMAIGHSNILRGFQDMKNLISSGITNLVHTYKVLFFTHEMEPMETTFSIGITYDGSLNTSNMNLHKHNEHNIFYPDDDYYNSNPLPKEWMSLFQGRTETEGSLSVESVDSKVSDSDIYHIPKYHPFIENKLTTIEKPKSLFVSNGIEKPPLYVPRTDYGVSNLHSASQRPLSALKHARPPPLLDDLEKEEGPRTIMPSEHPADQLLLTHATKKKIPPKLKTLKTRSKSKPNLDPYLRNEDLNYDLNHPSRNNKLPKSYSRPQTPIRKLLPATTSNSRERPPNPNFMKIRVHKEGEDTLQRCKSLKKVKLKVSRDPSGLPAYLRYHVRLGREYKKLNTQPRIEEGILQHKQKEVIVLKPEDIYETIDPPREAEDLTGITPILRIEPRGVENTGIGNNTENINIANLDPIPKERETPIPIPEDLDFLFDNLPETMEGGEVVDFSDDEKDPAFNTEGGQCAPPLMEVEAVHPLVTAPVSHKRRPRRYKSKGKHKRRNTEIELINLPYWNSVNPSTTADSSYRSRPTTSRPSKPLNTNTNTPTLPNTPKTKGNTPVSPARATPNPSKDFRMHMVGDPLILNLKKFKEQLEGKVGIRPNSARPSSRKTTTSRGFYNKHEKLDYNIAEVAKIQV